MPSLKSLAAAFVLALALASAPAVAVQDLTIGTAMGLRGQTVSVPLTYTGDSSVVAFQADVTYDPAALGSPTVSTGANLGGNLVRNAVVSSGRLRLAIYSPINAPIGNGILVRLSFTINSGAPSGASAVGLTSALLGNASAVSIPATHLGAGSVQILAGVVPQVASFGSVGDTGDGLLAEKEISQVSFTQLLVRFNTAVSDPAGNTQAGDVTNPASYRLIMAGPTGVPGTVSCAGGLAAGDVAVSVDAVSYDAASTTAALSVGGGLALPKGIYRLLVCPSITSTSGVALDGNGDGTPGDEALRSFEVGRTNLLRNPNFDKDLLSWILVRSNPAEIQLSSIDRDGAATSGSAQVKNLTGAGQIYSLAQCVALPGKGPYGVRGQARITSGRTTAPSFYAAIEYHAGAGCTGTVVGSALTPVIQGDSAGTWKPLSAFVQSPDAAVSALVMFALDSGVSPDFTALLDELSFERAEIFKDGFESGDTSHWPVALSPP